jgi:pre-rRNA-processing protein TSR4
LAKCKVCNGLLSLLLELNGDLPEQFPGHERRLYIWICKRKTCRRKEGSARGIRGVRVAKGAGAKAAVAAEKKVVEPQATPLPQLGESLFGVKNGAATRAPGNPFANPFASNGAGNAPANPFSPAGAATNPFASTAPTIAVTREQTSDEASTTLPETFASKVRLSSPPPTSQAARPHEPWPAESDFPPPYPQYYLDAEYETLDAPLKPQIPENTRMDVDTDGGGAGGKEDKEVFESSLDKTFQKFADRVGQNPEQVIRYEYRGKPLLYSDRDSVGKLLAPHSENAASSNAKVTTSGSRGGGGMVRCPSCGADRVFEVQLTPHAITELEADDMGIDGMEWGSILLGVCSKDCKPSDVSEGEVGYLEEWVGVQWEEVEPKR